MGTNGGFNILDLFWIFFMLSAIQPILRQQLLNAARQRAIAALEHERNSRVILLIHRQETMALLGFPILRYISIQDSEQVLRALQMTDPEVPIDLVLHTPGGLVLAAEQIARAMKHRPGKVTVHVPHHAMSGGTLIALAADEIAMAPHAVLGPVDPQLGKYPAASILKVIEQKQPKDIDDETMILADQARKAIDQVRGFVSTLLQNQTRTQEDVEKLATLLATGTWTHDHAITCDDARDMGLPVTNDIPPAIVKLLALFPQPVRQQPSVEYRPEPRRRPRDTPGN